ncbi:MAG: hypothetical protein AAGJ84_11965 [Pseudomonadota bacterium]
MRQTLFTRLAALLFGKRSRACKTASAADMVMSIPKRDRTDEAWLFEAEQTLSDSRDAYRADMQMAGVGFRSLRQKLSVITDTIDATESPIIVAGKLIEDNDLFDGTELVVGPVQDTTIGGEADFLFGEAEQSGDEARYAA